MSRTKRKSRGYKDTGNGAHHEVSPMGHATRTLSRHERRLKADRKRKQKGWI